MPETQGPIQHLTLAGYLFLIPLAPLFAALACAYLALRHYAQREENPRAPRPDKKTVTHVTLLGVLVAFAVSAYHLTLLLALPPSGRFLLVHLFRMVRVGQLDVDFDLSLDPLASVMCLVVTAIAGLGLVYAAKQLEKSEDSWRFFGWTNFLLASVLVVLLGDNLVVMLIGWEAAGVASWALLRFDWEATPRGSEKKFFVMQRVGDASLVVASALLFWGLGGSWTENDFAPDLNPRFAAISTAIGASATKAIDDDDDPTPATKQPTVPITGQGLLTMVSYPGALIFMDDSRAPLMNGPEPLRAPFVRFPIPGAIHNFRIRPGLGLDDHILTHVAMGGDAEVSLVVLGPTLSFREIRDQLVLKNAKGDAALRDALVGKRAFFGVGVLALACTLLFVAACTRSLQFPLNAWVSAASEAKPPTTPLFLVVIGASAGAYLVARASYLFILSSNACALTATVGVLTAVLAASIALFEYDLKRIVALCAASQLGLVMLGLGSGGYTGAVFHFVTQAFATACLFLAAESAVRARPSDVRRLGGLRATMPRTSRAYYVACLAIAAAPVPGLSGFWSRNEILVASVTTQNLSNVPRWGLFALGVVATAISAFALWRSYFLVFEGPPTESAGKLRESPKRLTGVLEVLAVISALGGALGLSTRWLGGRGESAIEDWLAPSFAAAHARFDEAGFATILAVALVSVGAAYGGFSLARSRHGERRAADWEAEERRARFFPLLQAQFHLDALFDKTVVALVLRLRDTVAEMDRWVIDGVLHGGSALVRATAWVSGKVDEHVVDAPMRMAAEETIRAGRMRANAVVGAIFVVFVILYLVSRR